MVGDGEDGMEVTVVALAARMMRWAVSGRRSQPFVPFSASRWATTMGRSALDVSSRVITSVRTPVRPMWCCGAGVGNFGRFTSVHHFYRDFTINNFLVLSWKEHDHHYYLSNNDIYFNDYL